METSYAHLSSIRVRANDTVVGGEVLGLGGATGNARGSHLHYTMSYKGVAINPEYLDKNYICNLFDVFIR